MNISERYKVSLNPRIDFATGDGDGVVEKYINDALVEEMRWTEETLTTFVVTHLRGLGWTVTPPGGSDEQP